MSVKPNYKKFVIFFKEKKIKLHDGGFVRLPPVLKCLQSSCRQRPGNENMDPFNLTKMLLPSSASSPGHSLVLHSRIHRRRRWSARHGRLRSPRVSRSVAQHSLHACSLQSRQAASSMRAPSKNSNQDSVWNLLVAPAVRAYVLGKLAI